MTDPNINRLLAKRYQIQELIGTGAMSRVYLAKDVFLGGVPVAIKFLTLSIDNQKLRVRERFEQEAKICALLSQKSIHIVQVMDYGVDENGTPFHVMEYLQGKNLSCVIRLQPLSLARFLSLSRQISLGLQCAHQGIAVDDDVCPIIHRDIKPSNILVMYDSNSRESIKILDFGIAKLLQAGSDRTNYYVGTLAYSSPEQMDGKEELDQRSDIYSLGIIMFEMLTGKMPLQPDTQSFGGWYKAHLFQPPRSFNSVEPRLNLPQALEDLVMSCMAKAPSDRPQSMGEILKALVLPRQSDEQSPEVQHSQDLSEATLSWPQNKPIANIVFSAPVSINGEISAALWVMLPEQEVQKCLLNIRYNQFLFITAPHPMMLWITVLYSRQYGPKWFPCYLDMKAPQSQEIGRLLGEKGYYRLLLFAREEPQQPCAYMLLPIAPAQCRILQQWLINSQLLLSVAEPSRSKSLLKKEFDEIKPQIITKLEAIRSS